MTSDVHEDEAVRSDADCAAFVEPPFFSQAGLFLTFRCTIGCAHCMVAAGPHRTESVSVPEAAGWISQMAGLSGEGMSAVGFTGGEPFCVRDSLYALASHARHVGLNHTIVTNGYWARSHQETRYLLAELRPIAMRVSTDAYHTDFIPLSHVERVYKVCCELGITCDIAVAYSPQDLLVTRAIISRLLTFAPREAIRTTRLFPSGRGDSQDHYGDNQAASLPVPNAPCLFASVPYILPNGDVLACVGPLVAMPNRDHPLFLGSLREQSLKEIRAAAERNVMLQGMRLWGPKFWHRLVERHGPRDALPSGYHSNSPCEGCVALLGSKRVTEFLADAAHSEELQTRVFRAREEILEETIPANTET